MKIVIYFAVFLLFFNSGILLAAEKEIRKNKTIRLGGYFYGCWKGKNGDMSTEQMIWVANHLNIISAHSTVSRNTVIKMREINLSLRFYIMTFATTLFEEPANITGWPSFDPKTMSGWVVRLKNGKEAIGIRRKSPDSNTHIMDLGSAEWADSFRSNYSRLVKERDANGIAIDEIMWNGYWGVKISEMDRYSSKDQIKRTCYDWLKRISAPHEFEIIHQAFWDEAQEFSNGIWGELAFYAEDSDDRERAVFYRKMNWEGIVRNIEKHGSEGRTYIWAAWYDRGNRSQLEYSLATYLMGKKSNSVVFHPQPRYDGGYPKNLAGYDIETVREEYEKNQKLFDIELGEPIEDAKKVLLNGTHYWSRKYTKGLVLCNPSDTSTVTVSIDRAMVDVDGNEIKEIILKPRTGFILLEKNSL